MRPRPIFTKDRKSTWRRRTALAIAVGATVIATGATARVAGFSINVTPSEPLGIWRSVPATTPSRGLLVMACVPPSPLASEAKRRGYLLGGSCPGDMAPVIKPVVAVAGDVVAIGSFGVRVNGQPVTRTAPAERDSAGRPLTAAFLGERTVPPGEVFLLSDYSPKSFDSRFFGPVPASNIRSATTPVLVTHWKPEGY